MRWVTHGVEAKISDAKDYFHLREINEVLANENNALRNNINAILRDDDAGFITVSDTVYRQTYHYTNARVTNNSVNKQHNFFTINKGTKNGVDAGMAVIADGGVAGCG